MTSAPTIEDCAFQGSREKYASRSLDLAETAKVISNRDRAYILEFVNDLRACKGITISRQNKIVTHLCGWRRYIKEFDQSTIGDLMAGINELRTDTTPKGKPYKTNTIIDYIKILKQFYTWMIEQGYSDIPEKRLAKIKAPPKPRMTKTAADILDPEEITAFLGACSNSRDRALFTLLYEAGPRGVELGRLTWRQLDFDKYGAIMNVDDKTGKPRYIRLVMSTEPLAAWKSDYPFRTDPDNLVFLNRLKEPVTWAAMAKQMKEIGHRAGIKKRITPHIFRHSRITHLIREGIPLPVVGMMFWGDPTPRELKTYLHLVNADIDRAVLAHYGMADKEHADPERVVVRECMRCHTINGPGRTACVKCGMPLDEEALLSMDDMERWIADNLLMINRVAQELERRNQ